VKVIESKISLLNSTTLTNFELPSGTLLVQIGGTLLVISDKKVRSMIWIFENCRYFCTENVALYETISNSSIELSCVESS
jgi:hypothetical protein